MLPDRAATRARRRRWPTAPDKHSIFSAIGAGVAGAMYWRWGYRVTLGVFACPMIVAFWFAWRNRRRPAARRGPVMFGVWISLVLTGHGPVVRTDLMAMHGWIWVSACMNGRTEYLRRRTFGPDGRK